MSKITVQIEWDGDEHWLNADNVAVALHAHCPNTRFVVTDASPSHIVDQTIGIVEEGASIVGMAIGSIG